MGRADSAGPSGAVPPGGGQGKRRRLADRRTENARAGDGDSGRPTGSERRAPALRASFPASAPPRHGAVAARAGPAPALVREAVHRRRAGALLARWDRPTVEDRKSVV